MREFSFRERLEIMTLVNECSLTMEEQPLIDYFNNLHTIKWENGKTITNSIIDNYFPDCHDRFRDKLLNMMIDFSFSFEKSLEPPVEENKILRDFAKKLTNSKIDIPSEFKQIVDDHFWDLIDPGTYLFNDSKSKNVFEKDNNEE